MSLAGAWACRFTATSGRPIGPSNFRRSFANASASAKGRVRKSTSTPHPQDLRILASP